MMGQAWAGGSPYFDESMGGQQPQQQQPPQRPPQMPSPYGGGMMQQRGGWGGFGGGGNYGGGYGGGFRNPMAQALRMYGSRMNMGGGGNMGMPMQSDKLPLANGGDPTLPPSAPPAGQSGNSQDAISNALATGNQAGLQGQGSQATNTDLNNSFYQQGVETPWYQQHQAELNRQGPAYQPGGIFGGPARNMGGVPV